MTDKDLKEFQELLDKFSEYPIEEYEPPFLELCHYSGERFEEICSRILVFFFQPRNRHGFKYMWFRALQMAVNDKVKENEQWEDSDVYNMETRTEERTTAGNRIDLVLETENQVVVIENKIWAPLYNDLKEYRVYVETTYKKIPNQRFIVLTGHSLSVDEEKKAEDNKYVVVLYKELFDKVEKILGEYVSKCNQKYLVHMLDFMQTVKNRVNIMAKTELDKFFEENYKVVTELEKQIKIWRDNRWNARKEAYEVLRSRLGEGGWQVYADWCLLSQFRDNYLFGIEALFEEGKDPDPIAEFHINITMWQDGRRCWGKLEDALREDENEELKAAKKIYRDGKIWFEVCTIKKGTMDYESYFENLKKEMEKYYKLLREVVDKMKEKGDL
ncbi:MAG: PD-(D/E)XK nuclease family protein [Bacteroidales bacterium]|nr:PD-(D/E)XK nuclease family protein [Bacteroidales bacterium]